MITDQKKLFINSVFKNIFLNKIILINKIILYKNIIYILYYIIYSILY